MKAFMGLVLGGDLDGMMLAHHAPVYRYPVLEDTSVCLRPIENTAKIHIHSLYHKPGVRLSTEYALDFWVTEPDASVQDCITALVDSYQCRTKERRRLAAQR